MHLLSKISFIWILVISLPYAGNSQAFIKAGGPYSSSPADEPQFDGDNSKLIEALEVGFQYPRQALRMGRV